MPTLLTTPATLTFGETGSAYAQNFTASGSGTITVSQASTCLTNPSAKGQASITPSSGTSGQAFTVTPNAPGTCSFTLTDAANATATLTISIATTTVTGQ